MTFLEFLHNHADGLGVLVGILSVLSMLYGLIVFTVKHNK